MGPDRPDAARQVADERGLRQRPIAPVAPRTWPHGWASSPRVHVEMHRPTTFLLHLERLHRGVPHRYTLNPAELHVEDPRGYVQHALLHPIVGEVAPGLASIEIVLLPLDHLGPVAALPAVHCGRVRNIPPLALEQHRILAGGSGTRCVHDAVDELRRVAPVPDHLVGGNVVGPVREAEEGRELVTRRQQAVQHRRF